MRILLAAMSHETNTFSPVPTKLDRFCRDGTTLLSGQAAVDFYRGTGTCMGGYLAVADEIGAEVVVPVCASAPPSGKVDHEAYETFCRLITDTVARGGLDAIWLDLHGAMVAEQFDDGEGELLSRIRTIDPRTPLCVAYDMHANIFPAMVNNAQVVTGYQTYPHIDQRQTAERAARALLRVMRREVKPTIAWGAAPMLPHVMAQGTHQAPNKDLQAMCAAWEASGRALAASLFVGFPHADVEMAGLSAVVVTDNDPAEAQAMVDELISAAWSARRDFMFDIEPLEASVARAKALGAPKELPVVLLDHYDNCASGGTMDTTDTLREIIRQDLDDVVFFGIYDPEAVQQAVDAGVGATVTLSIGAKLPMPQLPVASVAQLEAMKGAIFSGLDRDALQGAMPPGAARNALDCAFWDIDAKRAYCSVVELGGLGVVAPVMTAFTLGLDTPEKMADLAAANRTRPLLKLKLGGDGDIERVQAVRQAAPTARLIVDANESWDEARLNDFMPMLVDCRVELIEQPLPADALVRLPHPIPLCADEFCRTLADLDRLEGRYETINIKLDKVGLTAALALAAEGRRRGFRIMVGGTTNTSLGIAPALLVAQQADVVDLDGASRLTLDRNGGLRYDGGTIHQPDPNLWGGPG